jgi:curved DNA-binding protein CbpA
MGMQRRRKAPASTRPAERNPYEVLGIPQSASSDEIRRAYLEGVRRSPPERDPEGFKAIRAAYGFLKEAEKRRSLDLNLFRQASGLDLGRGEEADFTALFRERLFQLLLASSDLYSRSFEAWFSDLEEEVKKLS